MLSLSLTLSFLLSGIIKMWIFVHLMVFHGSLMVFPFFIIYFSFLKETFHKKLFLISNIHSSNWSSVIETFSFLWYNRLPLFKYAYTFQHLVVLNRVGNMATSRRSGPPSENVITQSSSGSPLRIWGIAMLKPESEGDFQFLKFI